MKTESKVEDSMNNIKFIIIVIVSILLSILFSIISVNNLNSYQTKKMKKDEIEKKYKIIDSINKSISQFDLHYYYYDYNKFLQLSKAWKNDGTNTTNLSIIKNKVSESIDTLKLNNREHYLKLFSIIPQKEDNYDVYDEYQLYKDLKYKRLSLIKFEYANLIIQHTSGRKPDSIFITSKVVKLYSPLPLLDATDVNKIILDDNDPIIRFKISVDSIKNGAAFPVFFAAFFNKKYEYDLYCCWRVALHYIYIPQELIFYNNKNQYIIDLKNITNSPENIN